DANLVSDALVKTVPIAGTLGEARTQRDKNRESISILDFFTRVERVAYDADKSSFDAHRPVQAFFDYIAVNNVGVAYASGIYSISKGIVFNVVSGLSSTRTVVGELDLQCLSAIEVAMNATLQQDFNWYGKITV